jgi:hypothetical protein
MNALRPRASWRRHLTASGLLADACFNKRADARAHDRANRCEFIVGSYRACSSWPAASTRCASSRHLIESSPCQP